MIKLKILVLDDEQGMLEVCEDTLSRLKNVSIITESDSLKGKEIIDKEHIDLLITDLNMPDISGVEILKHAKEKQPHVEVMLITAYPSIDTAVTSLKLGAFDYLTKPVDPAILLATVKSILEKISLKGENRLLTRYIEKPFLFDDMVGQSREITDVFELIKQVSLTDTDIIIVGESGTGKELVARSIHNRSKRGDKKFIPVDCGAIPENLLESEFFGHEKGAFTVAESISICLVDLAAGGTLFLDEICEMPLLLQAKLLRVLQERTFRRVGGREEIEADIRVIAATNRDIDKEVQEKRFRHDLFYRLNVVRIKLPPLSKRHEDIPLLVNYFIKRFSEEMGKPVHEVDPEAIEVFQAYSWPGNIRELQNILKRMITFLPEEKIHLEDIPEEIISNADQNIDLEKKGFFYLRKAKLAEFETDYIASLLSKYSGDVKKAAGDAMLPLGSFYRFMNKHGMDPGRFRS
jgi:DNA-binding NtrC family response regulator